jgi:acyl-CoA reductase-like NAD-dependent aldehyde dehydrogenase
VTQETSIADSVAVFRLHAKRLQKKLEMNRVGDGFALQNRLPGNVSAIILPWSDPVFSLCRKLAPALAVGGPVICKPSHLSPSAALRIAELCIEAGLPPGVFNVVCGKREELGSALLEHPGVTLVSFTGTTEAGQKVYAKAAEGFKKVQLSLGGRNPVCVFNDVDLESTAQVVADIMFNFHRLMPERGSRLFVQETIYKQFLEALKVASLKLTTGPLPDESARIRFLAACSQAGSEKGKALFEPVEPAKKGFHVSPQAFVDLTLCSTLQQEEIPGPFASIASFKYQHDAVKHANNCPMGYSAYLFMKDEEKALKVAQKVEASRVYINTRAKRVIDAETYPVKQSGFGGDGPEALLDFFSKPNFIFANHEIKQVQG